MTSAEIDALEKATRSDASAVQPLARDLLGALTRSPRKEIVSNAASGARSAIRAPPSALERAS